MAFVDDRKPRYGSDFFDYSDNRVEVKHVREEKICGPAKSMSRPPDPPDPDWATASANQAAQSHYLNYQNGT